MKDHKKYLINDFCLIVVWVYFICLFKFVFNMDYFLLTIGLAVTYLFSSYTYHIRLEPLARDIGRLEGQLIMLNQIQRDIKKQNRKKKNARRNNKRN